MRNNNTVNLLRYSLLAASLLVSLPSYALKCFDSHGVPVSSSGNNSINVSLPKFIDHGKHQVLITPRSFVECQNESLNGYSDDHITVESVSKNPDVPGKYYWDWRDFGPVGGRRNVLILHKLQKEWLPFKLSYDPGPDARGKVISRGQHIGTIAMYKEDTWRGTDGEDPPNNEHFTWRIIASNDVYVKNGTCSFSQPNLNVKMPDHPPVDRLERSPTNVSLSINCITSVSLSYTLTGQTAENGSIFKNIAGSSPAKGLGIQISDRTRGIRPGEWVSLGLVDGTRELGLRATYEKVSGERISSGNVEALITATMTYN